MTEGKDIAPQALAGLKPERRSGRSVPPEFEPSLTALRQELSRLVAARKTEGKGWARRIVDSLTRGYQKRQSGSQALAAYRDNPNARTLDVVIDHFRKASPRRQRELRALALRFFLAALKLCKGDCLREDVDRVIRIGNDARELWSDGTNPGMYVLIVYHLAARYQAMYQESIDGNQASGGSNLEAFELAKKYFLEVIDTGHGGFLGTLSHMQLGFLCMMRCVHENTTVWLEMCIEHWECTLKESNTPQADWCSEVTLVADSTSDDLIAADGDMKRARITITYQLGVAYQLQYREDLDRDSRLQNLNTSIDYFEKAQVLYMEMKDSEVWLAKVRHSLAARLVLRWGVTREQSDVDRATDLLKTAQTVAGIDDKLRRRIKSELTKIDGEINGQ